MDFHHFVSALPVVQVRIFQTENDSPVNGLVVWFCSRAKRGMLQCDAVACFFFDPVRGASCDISKIMMGLKFQACFCPREGSEL